MVTFSSHPMSWFCWIAFLVGAPLLMGLVNKLKAHLSGRFGSPILQPYYDLVRLVQKETIYSRNSTWLSRAAPILVWNTTAFSALFLPLSPFPAAISFPGDIILFAYLLGLGRFFQILASFDVASSFEGMGASREARFAVFAEPIFFFTLGSLALITGQLSFQSILMSIAWNKPLFGVFLVVSLISIFFLMIAECSRMPVDDPHTHLELTMIHEVMILDASGFDLMLYQHASSLKLLLYAVLSASLLNPFGWLGPVWGVIPYIGIIVGLGGILSVIEILMARFKLILVPQFLLYATIIGMLNILIFTFSR